MSRPDERREQRVHAAAAADHILAACVAADPAYRITPAKHDAVVDLVNVLVRAFVAGGAR